MSFWAAAAAAARRSLLFRRLYLAAKVGGDGAVANLGRALGPVEAKVTKVGSESRIGFEPGAHRHAKRGKLIKSNRLPRNTSW